MHRMPGLKHCWRKGRVPRDYQGVGGLFDLLHATPSSTLLSFRGCSLGLALALRLLARWKLQSWARCRRME